MTDAPATCPHCDEELPSIVSTRIRYMPGETGCLIIVDGEGAAHRCASLDPAEEVELLRLAGSADDFQV